MGALCLYLFLPLHILSLIMLIYRRRAFPIIGRFPLLTCVMMTLVTPVIIWFGIILLNHKSSMNHGIPCWLIWSIMPIATSFLPILTLRAILLLCQVNGTNPTKNTSPFFLIDSM
jgi:hypothetical protein